MLGLSLRTVTLARQAIATWRVVVDSTDDATHFTGVKWAVDTPTNTTFSVRVRCATTKRGALHGGVQQGADCVRGGDRQRGRQLQPGRPAALPRGRGPLRVHRHERESGFA